ncbi:OTU domain-containing protein 6B [Histomonas meleagridis]|nr:OTU domain-containing protein 6B [Histomonas meleagridis]
MLEEADDPIYAIAEQITQSNNEQAKPAPPPPKPKPAAKPNKDKKRQKRLQKAQQRLALQSEIANAVNSTKTQSQAEYEQAELQLSKLHLKMHPVIGDGGLHEDILIFIIQKFSEKAADELRAHPNEYQSFAGCETSEEFEVYCNGKVGKHSRMGWRTRSHCALQCTRLRNCGAYGREGTDKARKPSERYTAHVSSAFYFIGRTL